MGMRELRVLPDPDLALRVKILLLSGPGYDFASNPSIDYALKVKYKIFFALFQDCFVLFNLIK